MSADGEALKADDASKSGECGALSTDNERVSVDDVPPSPCNETASALR
jgi:hypothetical protein